MRPRLPGLRFVVVACVAVALALGVRAIAGTLHGPLPGGGHTLDVQLGFWAFLITIAGAIFKGLQVAGKVALVALQWSVKALWWFATTTANGLKAVGHAFLIGLKASWEFLRLTYDSVIKPGLVKFWSWFDKFRHWLDATFGPVLEWLRIIRDHVIAFYRTWVRPWLDLIDVTRRTLRILSSLGIDWARALDAKLGQLQELIDRPFRIVLAKINEVINIVNRIVTVDGLIQRIALIRSLERDIRYAARALFNWRIKPLGESDWQKLRRGMARRTEAEVTREFGNLVARGEGPLSGLASEMAASWRIRFQSTH
jgi:hypothetical protein